MNTNTPQGAPVSCDLIVEGRLVRVSFADLFKASGVAEKLAWYRFYRNTLASTGVSPK